MEITDFGSHNFTKLNFWESILEKKKVQDPQTPKCYPTLMGSWMVGCTGGTNRIMASGNYGSMDGIMDGGMDYWRYQLDKMTLITMAACHGWDHGW